MIVLDTTVVTVALPAITADLHVSGASVTWMLNMYMLTFGGFLLLSGRLGDLYGRRRLFLAGISVFTLASLACGLAHTQTALFIGRGVQGLGGAMVTAVSLSLVINLSSNPAERARAVGIYGMVCAAGGSTGELLGGLVTKALGWHWIFLVNVPIGIVVCILCVALLPRDRLASGPRQLDAAGAVAITSALTLLTYALVNGNEAGWLSMQTQVLVGVVGMLMILFFSVEARVLRPLMPLRMLRLRNFATANVIGILWAAGGFAWLVISALYLQRVLNYDSVRVGLSFVPSEIIVLIFSAGLAARMVMRFGTRGPLWIGLLLVAAGLVLFARAPLGGAFLADVLPGMLLLGVGSGMASTPLLLAAMNDVNSEESGLASGIVNTAFMMGGAFGLAVLASLAEVRTHELERSGVDSLTALNGGYHFALLGGALLSAMAAVIGGFVLRPGRPAATIQPVTVSPAG